MLKSVKYEGFETDPDLRAKCERLSAVIDDISLVVTWERWEGTIEHTLMAPVPRPLHLAGMCLFSILHATARTLLIFAVALLFFRVDVSAANWWAAAVVLLVGNLSIAGLSILAGVLPLLFPERGAQMTLMVQAAVLLVSGVYYSVDVLPSWLQVFAAASPAASEAATPCTSNPSFASVSWQNGLGSISVGRQPGNAAKNCCVKVPTCAPTSSNVRGVYPRERSASMIFEFIAYRSSAVSRTRSSPLRR